MLAPGHRTKAEKIEATIAKISTDPDDATVVIEACWGAAFHWIAYGTQEKHGKHQESHARLTTYLKSLGEAGIGIWWDELERTRQGGWYGNRDDVARVTEALDLLGEIRRWATS